MAILAWMAAATTPTDVPGQRVRPSIERPHVLAAVVDSELDGLSSSADVEYGLVLMSHFLKPVALGLRAVRAGRIDTRGHPPEWLGLQVAKAGVARACEEDTMRACLHHDTDVVLALSEPSFRADGSVRLQAARRSRLRRPNGDVRGHFSHYRLTLQKVDGRWQVTDRTILGVT